MVSESSSITNETPFDLIYEFINEEVGLSLGVNPHIYNLQDVCLFNVGVMEQPLSKGLYRVVFHIPGGLFCEGHYRVDNLYFSHNDSYFNHKNAHSFSVTSERGDFFGNYVGVIYPTSVTGEIQKL